MGGPPFSNIPHPFGDYCKEESFLLDDFLGEILKGDNAWEVMAMPQSVHSQKAPVGAKVELLHCGQCGKDIAISFL